MADTASNVVMRSAKVEYGATTGYGVTWPIVKDVKIKVSPAISEIDSLGYTHVPGYKVEGQFRIMENDKETLNSIFTLVGSQTAVYLRFTDNYDEDNSYKSYIPIVLTIDTEIDMNGKADGILLKFAYYATNINIVGIIGD
jgi:hypothetical protein